MCLLPLELVMNDELDNLREAIPKAAWCASQHIVQGCEEFDAVGQVQEAARSYLALMEGVREVWWCEEHESPRLTMSFCQRMFAINPKAVVPCRMVPAKLFFPGEGE
jgi:hypothetical protein